MIRASLVLTTSLFLTGGTCQIVHAQPADEGIKALEKRVAELEKHVLELRRQAGVQTMVESVATQIRTRKPGFRTMRLEKGIQIAKPEVAGPVGPGAKTNPFSQTGRATPVVDPRETLNAQPVLKLANQVVTRGELEDEIRFANTFVPGSPKSVMRHVLGRSVLPRLAVMNSLPDQVAAMRGKMEQARQKLMSGTPASEISGDGVQGSSVGPFERGSEHFTIAKHAFETDKDGVTPMFFSERGCHVLKVTDKARRSDDPGAPLVVTAQHLFLPFQVGDGNDALQQLIDKAKSELTFELFDTKYKDGVPKGYQVKLGAAPAVNADGAKVPNAHARPQPRWS